MADLSRAEIGDLIHVNPDAVERQKHVELSELLIPVSLDSWVEEIREVSWPRPDLHFQVSLTFPSSHVKAHCKNILETGLQPALPKPRHLMSFSPSQRLYF